MREKFCISKWLHVCNVLIYYINTNEILNHFTLVFCCCEGCNLLCNIINNSNSDLFTCKDTVYMFMFLCKSSPGAVYFIGGLSLVFSLVRPFYPRFILVH